jgi:hypothetical protein
MAQVSNVWRLNLGLPVCDGNVGRHRLVECLDRLVDVLDFEALEELENGVIFVEVVIHCDPL